MRKLLAVSLMFFSTSAMAEDITLRCITKDETGSDMLVRLNDEEQTIITGRNIISLNVLDSENVIHWSDKFIIFSIYHRWILTTLWQLSSLLTESKVACKQAILTMTPTRKI